MRPKLLFLVTIFDLTESEEAQIVEERNGVADAVAHNEESGQPRLDGASSEDPLLGLDIENELFSDDEFSSMIDDFTNDDFSEEEILSFLNDVLGHKRKSSLVIEDLEFDSSFVKKQKFCNTSKNHAGTIASDEASGVLSASSDDFLRFI